MVIPNVTAIILLSGVISSETKDYRTRLKEKSKKETTEAAACIHNADGGFFYIFTFQCVSQQAIPHLSRTADLVSMFSVAGCFEEGVTSIADYAFLQFSGLTDLHLHTVLG